MRWASTERGGVDLDLGEAVARIEIARDGAVRVRAATGRALPPDPSDALGREPWRASNAEPFALDAGREAPGPPGHQARREAPGPLGQTSGGVALAFDGADGAARVEIDERPFEVRIFDRSGREIAHLLDFAFAQGGAGRVALRAAPG